MDERGQGQQGQGPVIRDKRRIDPLTGEVRQPAAEGAAGVDGSQQSWAGSPEQYDDGAYAGAGYPPPYTAPGYDGSQGEPTFVSVEQAATAYGHNAGAAPEHEPESYEPESYAPEPMVSPDDSSSELIAAANELAERTADLQRLQAEYANYRRRVERDRGAVREQALANVLTNLLPLLDDVARARDHGDLTGGFRSVGESLEATVEKLGLTRFGEAGEAFDPSVHEALTHSYSSEVTEATAVALLQPGYRLGEKVLRPARVAVAEPE